MPGIVETKFAGVKLRLRVGFVAFRDTVDAPNQFLIKPLVSKTILFSI